MVLMKNSTLLSFGDNNVNNVKHNYKDGQLGLGEYLANTNTPIEIGFLKENINSISTGYYHSIILKDDKMYSFGNNVIIFWII
jgi:alpha-tubulin suppressor-like RCC1 family protein